MTTPAKGPFGTAAPQPAERPLSCTDDDRRCHETWLRELTSLPTAAGREGHVIRWIEAWVEARPELRLERDEAGNLVIRTAAPAPDDANEAPLFITAHLDHPAFVVERVEDDGRVELTFRGSVRDPYFVGARLLVHTAQAGRVPAQLEEAGPAQPLRRCVARLEGPADTISPGDVATWDLPDTQTEGDLLLAPACDDLAGVAAALAAMDVLRLHDAADDVRLLLTRAEEVGFIGAIRACRLGTMPAGSRVIALETSRSFAESPIGAGPIVRVGDRISTFDPNLTRAIAQIAAEEAVQDPQFRWQRRLMDGGACEATAFCAFGYAATCLCLPLGNYHNMADLDEVEHTNPAVASIGPEFISITDFHGLVRLLVGCGARLRTAEPIMHLLDRLESERRFVLER